MTHRTAVLSSIETYLTSEDDSAEERADQNVERDARLIQFPFALMLELAFPERDFANRWCWDKFGPEHGECEQEYSEYPVCKIECPHCHVGKWDSHWFVKTDYDFGFNEWYFAEQSDRDIFLASVSKINWGEHYPK